MPRISLKIVGASGQGITSIGAIIAKGLKRSGYCVFGYREYPSLIKGGHASYQLDVSNERICSTETRINVLVALNHHGPELNMEELKQGGIVLHVTPGWQFPEHHRKLISERSLRVIYFPVDDILNRLGARAILSNVLLTAFVWSILDQDIDALKSLVGETFAKKKALLELNMRCIAEGYSFVDPEQGTVLVALPPPDKGFASHLLITGSQAMGLGAVHAGVRLYAGYPMTPSSPLLSFIAGLENKTHMVVKQAEDEITAAQIVSGAMYMGTRALTATSGVGFDLMSETLSLNAMIENPAVFVLAQRPGSGDRPADLDGSRRSLAGRELLCWRIHALRDLGQQQPGCLRSDAGRIQSGRAVSNRCHCAHRQTDRRGALHATPLRSGKGRYRSWQARRRPREADSVEIFRSI